MALQTISWPWPPIFLLQSLLCLAALQLLLALSSLVAAVCTLPFHMFSSFPQVFLLQDFLPEFLFGIPLTIILVKCPAYHDHLMRTYVTRTVFL